MQIPHSYNNISQQPDDQEEEYDEFTMLERLETLREDMEDLGVTTLHELIARIEKMHHQLPMQ